MSKDITIIAKSVFGVGICISKDMSDEDALEWINRNYPSGSEYGLGWTLAKKISCEQDEHRIHLGFIF